MLQEGKRGGGWDWRLSELIYFLCYNFFILSLWQKGVCCNNVQIGMEVYGNVLVSRLFIWVQLGGGYKFGVRFCIDLALYLIWFRSVGEGRYIERCMRYVFWFLFVYVFGFRSFICFYERNQSTGRDSRNRGLRGGYFGKKCLMFNFFFYDLKLLKQVVID